MRYPHCLVRLSPVCAGLVLATVAAAELPS
jgi:hypothetical protein